jgi:hypothetical protein
MRWFEQYRRRRTDKKRRRDEKRKQSLRPRIAEAARAVVPSTEHVLIQAVGDVSFLPSAPPTPRWSMRGRLSAMWRSLGRGYRSYIFMTDRHLIVLRQSSQVSADLTVPLARIGGAHCRHNKFVWVPMGYSNVTVPEHVEIWIDVPGDAEVAVRVSRPWLSEAAEFCTTLRAIKEPSDFWEHFEC